MFGRTMYSHELIANVQASDQTPQIGIFFCGPPNSWRVCWHVHSGHKCKVFSIVQGYRAYVSGDLNALSGQLWWEISFFDSHHGFDWQTTSHIKPCIEDGRPWIPFIGSCPIFDSQVSSHIKPCIQLCIKDKTPWIFFVGSCLVFDSQTSSQMKQCIRHSTHWRFISPIIVQNSLGWLASHI